MITIAVAGGTCSGKTTLAEKLENRLSAAGLSVCVLHMDAFFKKVTPTVIAPFTGIEYPEHNHPDSFELEKFYAAIDEAKAGNYDAVIVEGLLTLYLEEVRKRSDIRVFVDLPSDERLIRRIHKFMELRHQTMDEIADRFLDTVRYRHNEFVEPSRWYADMVVNGNGEKGADILAAYVKSLIQG